MTRSGEAIREGSCDWNGAGWARASAAIPNTDLNSVYCVNSNDCWAVGDDSGGEVNPALDRRSELGDGWVRSERSRTPILTAFTA